jgi:hypothetical protein
VTQNSHHPGRVHDGSARRSTALSTLAFALAATAALAALVTEADARAREISASSYGFADSLLPDIGLEHLPTLSPPGSDGALKCSVNCTVVVERLEPDASGSLTNWVVVSERTIDENGSHSWSLLSGAPSNTPWLPNDLPFRGLLVLDRSSCRYATYARSVDLGDDAHRLRRARHGRISKP